MQIGKSDTYINKLESKDFTLSLPVLFEIIEALEVTPAEFFADNLQITNRIKKFLICLILYQKKGKILLLI